MADPQCRMLKKTRLLTRPSLRAETRLAPSKAAASEEARRTLRYVEPLSDARTPLPGFFSILLRCELQDPKGYARWRPRQTSNG